MVQTSTSFAYMHWASSNMQYLKTFKWQIQFRFSSVKKIPNVSKSISREFQGRPKKSWGFRFTQRLKESRLRIISFFLGFLKTTRISIGEQKVWMGRMIFFQEGENHPESALLFLKVREKIHDKGFYLPKMFLKL